MSTWNHNLCLRCYENENTHGRDPVRFKNPELDTCCRCGTENRDGIYYRQDPKVYRCRHYTPPPEDTDTGSDTTATVPMVSGISDVNFDAPADSSVDFSDVTSGSSTDSGTFERGGGDFGGGGASGDF